MSGHPCEACPRWWECDGVEWETCPRNPLAAPEMGQTGAGGINTHTKQKADRRQLQEE